MTADTAIKRFDALYPNVLTYEEKLNMLSELDGRIFCDVLSLGDDAPELFGGYSPETAEDRELLAAFPHDSIYIKYLAAQADLINGDTVRYYNSHTVFNAAYEEYAAHINRTRRRKAPVSVRLGGDAV